MKILKTNLCNLTALVLSIAASSSAWAHGFPEKTGYLIDERGNIVRNSYGECWRTGYWTPAMAIEECDPGLVKKEVKQVEAPKKAPPPPLPPPVAAPAPAPVVVPPAPPPVVAPAPPPKPKEQWKTILTEKPVRLEGANFATNSATLLKTADVKLNEVVNAAKQYPEVKLEVSGHTDSRGSKALNKKLSENRAAAVKAWLVKHGVAADRISTAGYADEQPIADNKTEAGRAANRRVEVRYAVKEEKSIRVTE